LDERNAEEDKTVHWQITALWAEKKWNCARPSEPSPRSVGWWCFGVSAARWLSRGREQVSAVSSYFPNAIDPAETFTAFLLSVVAGARRFAHTSLLRADVALHAVLGSRAFLSMTPFAICSNASVRDTASVFSPLVELAAGKASGVFDGI